VRMLKLAEISKELTETEKNKIGEQCLHPFLSFNGYSESKVKEKDMESYWESWKSFKESLEVVLKKELKSYAIGYYISGDPEEVWKLASTEDTAEKNYYDHMLSSGKEDLAKESDPEVENMHYNKLKIRRKNLKVLFDKVLVKAADSVTAKEVERIMKDPSFLPDMYWFLRQDILIEDLVKDWNVPGKDLRVSKAGGLAKLEDSLLKSLSNFCSLAGGSLVLAHKHLIPEQYYG
jgi:hypothetical protein